MFKWLTGQLPAPPDVASNAAFAALRADVAAAMAQKAPEGTRARPGAEWRRGWSDGQTPVPAA